MLVERFHIYLPATGRINIAGLSPSTIDTVAHALDIVVREFGDGVNGGAIGGKRLCLKI